MSTVLLTQITRTGTYPAQIPLDVTYNRGFISFVTNNWTAQMFYELPAIKLDLYTDVEGTMVRSPLFSRTIKTYNPTFPLDQQCSICISMKDVPANCYLFVTPIFDNNAIEARNELIRNGIEDGQLWTTKTNTFNILLSYEDNDSVPTNTITQQPPISFTSDGTSLFSWSMSGNGSQSGTPTPDAPIMPTFCGVRTVNLAWTGWAQDFVTRANNTNLAHIGQEDGRTCLWYNVSVGYDEYDTKYIFKTDWAENTQYTISFYAKRPSTQADATAMRIEYTDGSVTQIYTYARGVFEKYTVTSEAGKTIKYIRAAYTSGTLFVDIDTFMVNAGTTALPYEPFGWAEKITCAGQTSTVYLGQTQTLRRVRKTAVNISSFITLSNGNKAGVHPFNDASTYAVPGFGFCDIALYDVLRGTTGMFYVNQRTAVFVGDSSDTLATLQDRFNGANIWYALETEQTGIINEPLCKIGDYADELHSEDTTVTIPTIKGQNTLTVEGDLQPSSMTITGNIK